MLERSALLLRPQRTTLEPSAGAAPAWVICDLASGEVLGGAGWEAPNRWKWWRWLARPVLAVYETEDRALLLTVRQAGIWARYWEVWDADDHRVGVVAPTAVWNWYGEYLAAIEYAAPRATGYFRTPDGRTLASFTRSA